MQLTDDAVAPGVLALARASLLGGELFESLAVEREEVLPGTLCSRARRCRTATVAWPEGRDCCRRRSYHAVLAVNDECEDALAAEDGGP